MSLLRDIQDAATSDSTSLSVVLRKCKVLSARLANASLAKWVDAELNGYEGNIELPPYRILEHVESRGHFAGVAGSSLQGAPIPPACLPEKARDIVRTVHLREGVATYEDLLRANPDGDFQVPWPADMTAAVGRKIYRYMNCISAWQDVSRGTFVGLLDTVRNRILNFALEIEAAAPDAGESPAGQPRLSEGRVNQVFNTVILGGTNTIAAAGSGALAISMGVVAGDIASLTAHLSKLGLSDTDTRELAEVVANDPAPESEDHFGPKVSAWIGKMASKAASGAWQIGSSVASDVLSKALLKYYGL